MSMQLVGLRASSIAIVVFLSLPGFAPAADYVWNNTTDPSTSWVTGTNWLPVGPPNAFTDTATFNAGAGAAQTVTLDQLIQINVLTIDSTSTAYLISGNGGSLAFGGSGAALTVGAGSTVAQQISADVTVNSALAISQGGGAALTLSGAWNLGGNTVTVGGTGATAFTGIVSAGGAATLTINNSTTTFAGINLATNSLTINGTGSASASGAITAGAGSVLTVSTTGTSSFTGSYMMTGSSTITVTAGSANFATADLGGANTLAINGAGNTSFSGAIAGAGGIISKSAAGTLTLSGNSTFSGAVNLSGGILRATTSAGSLGIGALNLSGGELQLANDTGLAYNLNTTVSGNVQIASDRLNSGAGVTHTLGTLSMGAQTLTVAAGTNVASGTAGLTFGAATLTGASAGFTVNAGTLLTLSSTVGGTNTAITKLGPGTMTVTGAVTNGTGTLAVNGGVLNLAGANVYSGATTISSAATLNITNAGALGTSAVTVSSGGVLSISTTGNVANALNLAGTGISGGGALVANNTASLTGTIPITVASGGATISVASGLTLTVNAATTTIAFGTNTLTKIGTGTLAITAKSTTGAGTLAVNGGTFTTNAANVNLTATTVNIASGATFQMTGNGVDGLAAATVFNVTSGGVIDLRWTGATETTGTLNLNGTGIGGTGALVNNGSAATGVLTATVTLQTDTTIGTGSAAATLNLASAIGGTGKLTKVGAGTLTASSGSNTFSGGLSVLGGTLNIGSIPTTGAVTVGDTTGSTAATLTVTGSAATYSNAFTVAAGSSGVKTIGANTGSSIVLGGTGTVNDNLTVAEASTGSLRFGGNLTFASKNLTVNNSGTGSVILSGTNTGIAQTIITSGVLQYNSQASLGGTTKMTGSAGTTGTQGSTAVLNFTATPSLNNLLAGIDLTAMGGTIAISSGNAADSLNFGSGGFNTPAFLGATGLATYTGTFTPQGTTYRFGGGGGTLTYNADIAAGSVVIGGGTSVAPLNSIVVLGGNNTYAGGTTITNNTLSIGSNANIGGPTSSLAFDGGILQVTGTSLNNLTTNTVIFANNKNVGIDINAAGNTFTLDKNMSIGTGSFTKAGAGTLVVTGTAAYTGGTVISGGTLKVGPSGLGTPAALNMSGTSSLDLNGRNVTVTDTPTSAATNSIVDTGTGTGTDTFTILSQATVYAGLISNGTTRAVAVAIANGNTNNTSLSNTGNTFAGGLTLLNSTSGTRLGISSSMVTTGSPGALTSGNFGTGPITIGLTAVDKAGIFVTTASLVIPYEIVFNTNLGTDRFGIRADVTGVTFSGRINANLASATFTTNTTGSFVVTGQITGPQGLILDASQNSTTAQTLTVTLNNTGTANDYRGDTVINRNAAASKISTLTLGANDQIPNGVGFGNVNVITNGTGIGTLQLNGKTETINGLLGNGTVTTNATTTLTLGDGNAITTFSGTLTQSAGNLSLTKIGLGSQTLSGTDSYTGATTISAGQLVVSGTGTLASATTLSVAAGARFVYNPATLGAQTVASLTLAAGSGIGTTWNATTSSSIASTAAATTPAGTVYLAPSGTFTSGTQYTLLTAPGGLDTPGASGYLLLNPTNFTATVAVAPDSVKVMPTTATALTTAFWFGGFTAAPAVWAASDGAAAGNWATTQTAAAVDTPLVPGAGAAVTFSNNNASAGNQVGMVLGADMSIASLNLSSANPISVNGDGSTLTIAAVGGITVASTSGTVTLNNNFALGASQSWTNNSTTNTLNIGGAVNLGANTLTFAGAGSQTISGPVTGTGGIAATGSGIVALTGANSYTGATTIAGSTLRLGGNQTLGGTLTFGATAGAATAGTLDLSTLGATATFNTALVQTKNTTANTITVAAGQTLTLANGLTMGYDAGSGTGANASNLTVSGAGRFAIGGATINISVNQAAQNAAYFSSATLDVRNLTGGFYVNVTTFNIGVGGTTQGLGKVLLSNTTNTIIATTLVVGDTGANNGNGSASLLTLGTGTNIINADTIQLGRGKQSGPGTLSWASSTAGPGSLVITNKAGTGGANIDIANDNATATSAASIGTLDLRGHQSTVLAGTLTMGNLNMTSSTGNTSATLSFDTGTFTVNVVNMAPKTAAGTGTANATINIGGGVFTVNPGGSFTMGSQATAGASVATVNVTGGTLISNVDILRGAGTTTSVLVLNGGMLDLTGHVIGSAAAPVTIGPITPTATPGFQAGTIQNLAELNGGGTLLKSGTGTLILQGTNAYTGATTVSAGALRIASDTALGGTASGTSVAANAALEVAGNINVAAEALTLIGTGASSGGALRNVSGTNTYGGPITLGSASRINSEAGTLILNNAGGISGPTFGLTLGGAGSGRIDSPIGTTSGTLTKDGAGTWILNGANTYSGLTTVSVGTLQIGNGGTTGVLPGDAAIAATGTLTFNRSDSFTYAGQISGSGTLRQSGGAASVLSLTGNSSGFTGAVKVDSGKLAVGVGGTGALGGSSVTVFSGATLQGTGTVAANVTVNSGGFLKGGNSPGILTVAGNTSLAAGGNLNVDLVNTPTISYSQISITGANNSFNFAPGLVINVKGDGQDTGADYTLLLVQTANSNPFLGASPTGILYGGANTQAGQTFTYGSDYTVNLTGFQTPNYGATSLMVVDLGGGVQGLQLSVSTPEAHHVLLISAAALLAGLYLRRRVRLRAAA